MAEFEKGTPQVGLRFTNPDEAWKFWVAYGGCTGFDVRKRYSNVSSYDGKVTSCRFVCSNEGHRRKGQTTNVTKCFRAETRTDCKARISLTLDRGSDNYEVTDVVLEHNHLLHLPETRHLMATQRKISEVQAQFQKHFERAVEEKRAKELQSEFEARKNIPRRQMRTPMLMQASEVYTPVIFEAFQGEYERSMAACSRLLDENRYAISIGNFNGASFEKERIVMGDPLNHTATCSCQMFNRTGILCAHSLKVLDLMNIKILPAHYILKRWTREARNGRIQDKEGRNVVANPKLEAQLRIRNLSHKFLNLAYKAADYPDCCLLLEDGLDCLSTQLEDKLNLSTNVLNKLCNDQENVEPTAQQKEEFLAAQLKKKEVKSKNSRRKKSWLDKLPKGNRSLPTKAAEPKKKEPPTRAAGPKKKEPQTKATEPKKKQPKKRKQQDDGVHPLREVENDDINKGGIMQVEEYNIIGNFTQLVTAPICDDDIFHIDDLF